MGYKKPIAMPFSGGMDSFVNSLIMQEKEPNTPITYFYFRHGMEDEKELQYVEDYFRMDRQIHIIDDIQLNDLSPTSSFVPFRNLFFGLYLAGLGFDRILFSFSAEDLQFYDTTIGFTKELETLTKNHLGRDIEVFSNIINMSRVDMVDKVYSYGNKSHLWRFFRHTNTCTNEYGGCRKCVTCFMREIAFASKDSYVIDKEDFIDHWTTDPTASKCIYDLYMQIRNGKFYYSLDGNNVGRQYLDFLTAYEKGILLDN